MKLVLKGESGEIADLILAIQGQQKTINVTQNISKKSKDTINERNKIRNILYGLVGY